MPNVLKHAASFLAGSLATLLVFALAFPSMMLHETLSPFDVEATVAAVRHGAETAGWTVSKEYDFQATILGKTGKDVGPVKVVELCKAEYAAGLLGEDASKKVATMMPCAFAVYRTGDGRTRIASMNVGLMGRLFGGQIATTMAKVAADDAKILAFAGARP